MAPGKREVPPVGEYIDHLKALYGVAEDQELAEALGSTKAAIAKWRRRETIPAAIQNKVVKRFGPQWFWRIERDNFQMRFEQDAYAVCLYLMTELPSVRWDGLPDDDVQNVALKGAVFASLLSTIRKHIEQHLADVDSGQAVIARCIADYEAGRIAELESAVTLGWLIQQ